MAALIGVLEIVRIGRDMDVGAVINDAVFHTHRHDELAVLQIGQIVEGRPIAGIFDISEGRQPPRLIGRVGQLDPPDFHRPAERHEIGRFGADAGIIRGDRRVGGAVAALGFVLVERLADRLPGGAPEVTGLSVAQINIAPGLIERHGIEANAGEAALCGGFVERIAAGIVGDDGAILGRAEIVRPRARRIGPRDDIFARGVVEMAVLHLMIPLLWTRA